MVGYISSKDETGLGKYELDAAEKRLILTVHRGGYIETEKSSNFWTAK